jgi:hypothetical protein
MRLLIFILCLFSLCGCTSLHVINGQCEATYSSLFEDNNVKSVTVCDVRVEVIENNTNMDLFKAILEAKP